MKLNKEWVKKHKVAIIVTWLVIIVLSVAASGDKTNKSKKTDSKPQASNSQKVEKDTSDLNATVKLAYDVPGVEVTNNEDTNWDNCKFTLNNDWKRELRNPLEPHNPLNNPYGLLLKSDGSRFDVSTTQPKNFFIACKVNGVSRTNYYTF